LCFDQLPKQAASQKFPQPTPLTPCMQALKHAAPPLGDSFFACGVAVALLPPTVFGADQAELALMQMQMMPITNRRTAMELLLSALLLAQIASAEPWHLITPIAVIAVTTPHPDRASARDPTSRCGRGGRPARGPSVVGRISADPPKAWRVIRRQLAL
jgi:hypothetical protein